VKAFRRVGEAVSAKFEPTEADALATMAGQVAALVADRAEYEGDPAVLRLLPDAYPDDGEASAEFRRFTADDLAARKVANATTVVRSLEKAVHARSATTVTLDLQAAQAWLRALTDIRLTIAARLGIDSNEEEPEGDPLLLDVYDWLGFVQESLVAAVSE
jgi:hypothetical protein